MISIVGSVTRRSASISTSFSSSICALKGPAPLRSTNLHHDSSKNFSNFSNCSSSKAILRHYSCSSNLSSSNIDTHPNRFMITGSLSEKGPVIGAFCEVQHSFSQKEVNDFAVICGDNNPLHTDPEFAKNTMFQGTIVHGILVSSLFSTLFGRSVSGSVYVSQSLKFRKPVHIDAKVTARMEVASIEERSLGRFITCKTRVTTAKGDIAVDGEAIVLLPSKTRS